MQLSSTKDTSFVGILSLHESMGGRWMEIEGGSFFIHSAILAGNIVPKRSRCEWIWSLPIPGSVSKRCSGCVGETSARPVSCRSPHGCSSSDERPQRYLMVHRARSREYSWGCLECACALPSPQEMAFFSLHILCVACTLYSPCDRPPSHGSRLSICCLSPERLL